MTKYFLVRENLSFFHTFLAKIPWKQCVTKELTKQLIWRNIFSETRWTMLQNFSKCEDKVKKWIFEKLENLHFWQKIFVEIANQKIYLTSQKKYFWSIVRWWKQLKVDFTKFLQLYFINTVVLKSYFTSLLVILLTNL